MNETFEISYFQFTMIVVVVSLNGFSLGSWTILLLQAWWSRQLKNVEPE